MTQPQDKMRAEFEAWCGIMGMDFPRYKSGIYKDDGTASAWEAWKYKSAQSQQDALDATRSPSDTDLMDYLCSTKDGVIRMEYPTRFLHWSVDSIHSSPRAAISAAIAARASNGGKA